MDHCRLLLTFYEKKKKNKKEQNNSQDHLNKNLKIFQKEGSKKLL